MIATDGIGSRSSLAKVACPISALCLCAASERPINSLMSAPAQNALVPAPVISSARASLAATSSITRPSSRINANDSALSASGRFSVISANSSTRVSSIVMVVATHPAKASPLRTRRTSRENKIVIGSRINTRNIHLHRIRDRIQTHGKSCILFCPFLAVLP